MEAGPGKTANKALRQAIALPKVPTQIDGLDEILNGGIPAGGTTLVWGAAGCGKSILGLEFLYRGALADDPGDSGRL